MKADYHMHLERGTLTHDWLAQFWQTAEERGLSEIGVSEHGHRFAEFREAMRPIWSRAEGAFADWFEGHFEQRLDDYVRLIEDAKKAGMPVKLGLEMDYAPGMEEETARVLAAYPWDYVLGSVHFLGGWGFDFRPDLGWDDKDMDEVYESYFRTLRAAAETGLFDVLAHPDVIKVFGHRPAKDPTQWYEETADTIAKAGLAIEVSSAGLRKPVGEIYPASELLAAFAKRGVPIVLSSDAHLPGDVGAGFDKLTDWTRGAGYQRFCTFAGRHREEHPLE